MLTMTFYMAFVWGGLKISSYQRCSCFNRKHQRSSRHQKGSSNQSAGDSQRSETTPNGQCLTLPSHGQHRLPALALKHHIWIASLWYCMEASLELLPPVKSGRVGCMVMRMSSWDHQLHIQTQHPSRQQEALKPALSHLCLKNTSNTFNNS